MVATIKNIEKDTVLEFPFLYYPGYEITITYENGEKSVYDAIESENGFTCIFIDNDINQEAEFKIEFKSTTITKISYIISGVSFVILIFYIIYEKGSYKRDKNKVKKSEEIRK